MRRTNVEKNYHYIYSTDFICISMVRKYFLTSCKYNSGCCFNSNPSTTGNQEASGNVLRMSSADLFLRQCRVCPTAGHPAACRPQFQRIAVKFLLTWTNWTPCWFPCSYVQIVQNPLSIKAFWNKLALPGAANSEINNSNLPARWTHVEIAPADSPNTVLKVWIKFDKMWDYMWFGSPPKDWIFLKVSKKNRIWGNTFWPIVRPFAGLGYHRIQLYLLPKWVAVVSEILQPSQQNQYQPSKNRVV